MHIFVGSWPLTPEFRDTVIINLVKSLHLFSQSGSRDCDLERMTLTVNTLNKTLNGNGINVKPISDESIRRKAYVLSNSKGSVFYVDCQKNCFWGAVYLSDFYISQTLKIEKVEQDIAEINNALEQDKDLFSVEEVGGTSSDYDIGKTDKKPCYRRDLLIRAGEQERLLKKLKATKNALLEERYAPYYWTDDVLETAARSHLEHDYNINIDDYKVGTMETLKMLHEKIVYPDGQKPQISIYNSAMSYKCEMRYPEKFDITRPQISLLYTRYIPDLAKGQRHNQSKLIGHYHGIRSLPGLVSGFNYKICFWCNQSYCHSKTHRCQETDFESCLSCLRPNINDESFLDKIAHNKRSLVCYKAPLVATKNGNSKECDYCLVKFQNNMCRALHDQTCNMKGLIKCTECSRFIKIRGKYKTLYNIAKQKARRLREDYKLNHGVEEPGPLKIELKHKSCANEYFCYTCKDYVYSRLDGSEPHQCYVKRLKKTPDHPSQLFFIDFETQKDKDGYHQPASAVIIYQPKPNHPYKWAGVAFSAAAREGDIFRGVPIGEEFQVEMSEMPGCSNYLSKIQPVTNYKPRKQGGYDNHDYEEDDLDGQDLQDASPELLNAMGNDAAVYLNRVVIPVELQRQHDEHQQRQNASDSSEYGHNPDSPQPGPSGLCRRMKKALQFSSDEASSEDNDDDESSDEDLSEEEDENAENSSHLDQRSRPMSLYKNGIIAQTLKKMGQDRSEHDLQMGAFSAFNDELGNDADDDSDVMPSEDNSAEEEDEDDENARKKNPFINDSAVVDKNYTEARAAAEEAANREEDLVAEAEREHQEEQESSPEASPSKQKSQHWQLDGEVDIEDEDGSNGEEVEEGDAEEEAMDVDEPAPKPIQYNEHLYLNYANEEEESLENVRQKQTKNIKRKAPPGRQDDEVDQFNPEILPPGIDSYPQLMDYMKNRYCEHETVDDWYRRSSHKWAALRQQLDKGTVLERVMQFLINKAQKNAVALAHFGKGKPPFCHFMKSKSQFIITLFHSRI